MALSATSFSGNGLRDWIFQRVSALVLAVYFFVIVAFLVCNADLSFATWSSLFASLGMKIFTLFALLSMLIHAWIGLWTVITDYVKCAYARMALYLVVLTVLLSLFGWGITIVWGI